MPQSDRIMTRSRARQNPDQYTTVSAQLKIIKLFIGELLTGSADPSLSGAVGTAADLEDGDDDGEWEDDPTDFLDLGSGMTKSQLMSLGAEDNERDFGRQRDDETQRFLLEFFRQEAEKAEFGQMFAQLNDGEQEKLRSLS